MEFLIIHEQAIRLSVFLGLMTILAVAELMAPLANRRVGRAQQWVTNILITIFDTLILKIFFPLLAVGVAHFARTNGFGLFNLITINYWVNFILSLLLLDLLIYGQHVMMHKVPMLWRLHRMHHSELGLDVTSAVRFHPIEIVISMLIKMLFVLILGIPVAAVIIFEILLNGLALFNHSNLKLPGWLESVLRRFIITPELHWIHHSEIIYETNSNFGFNLCIWDKIFSTYVDKPTLDYTRMRQGLPEFGYEKPLNFIELIMSPFRDYPQVKDMKEP